MRQIFQTTSPFDHLLGGAARAVAVASRYEQLVVNVALSIGSTAVDEIRELDGAVVTCESEVSEHLGAVGAAPEEALMWESGDGRPGQLGREEAGTAPEPQDLRQTRRVAENIGEPRCRAELAPSQLGETPLSVGEGARQRLAAGDERIGFDLQRSRRLPLSFGNAPRDLLEERGRVLREVLVDPGRAM